MGPSRRSGPPPVRSLWAAGASVESQVQRIYTPFRRSSGVWRATTIVRRPTDSGPTAPANPCANMNSYSAPPFVDSGAWAECALSRAARAPSTSGSNRQPTEQWGWGWSHRRRWPLVFLVFCIAVAATLR
jgi:hypothetical protein